MKWGTTETGERFRSRPLQLTFTPWQCKRVAMGMEFVITMPRSHRFKNGEWLFTSEEIDSIETYRIYLNTIIRCIVNAYRSDCMLVLQYCSGDGYGNK